MDVVFFSQRVSTLLFLVADAEVAADGERLGLLLDLVLTRAS
jgi:hypothetical protein